jgi:uncharacterized protein (DUF58 family)
MKLASAPFVAAVATTPPARWLGRWHERVFRHAASDGAGITLRHSRIYILPTRRGVALIATIATMLVTSLNYGLSLGFVVTFVLTGLVGAALLHTFRNLAGLAIRPGAVGETFAGGSLPFTLSMSGGLRTRAAIAIATRDGSVHVVDVDADTLTTVTFEVAAPRRGRVPLGRVTLSSDYPLGLWRGWAYAHFPNAGIAYPEPEAGAPPLPKSAAGPDAHARGRDDEADLSGLREYQRGDPLQRVAWKAVARGAGWYTKAFDGAGGGGPVVLDLAQVSDGALEHKLSRLAAWVLACERAGRPYSLVLPGLRLPTGAGREHRRSVLTALALHGDGA